MNPLSVSLIAVPMRSARHGAVLSLPLLLFFAGPIQAIAADATQEAIGVFTSVHGQVSVLHPKAVSMIPAVPREAVQFRDIIETQRESRTRALFDDDSLLTVGERSRVEITEYVYDPAKRHRNVVVKLLQGTLRALVSKLFTGSGSRFEVHTPTVVAAARGTYFVVWTDGDVSGVVNIGEAGRVDVTAGGKTVTLRAHQFSTARPGGVPTLPASVGAMPLAAVGAAVVATEGKEAPEPVAPGQAISQMSGAQVLAGQPAVGGQSPVGPPPTVSGVLPPGLAGTTPGQSGTAPGRGGSSAASPAPPFTVSAPVAADSIVGGGGPGGGPPCGTPPCGNAFGRAKGNNGLAKGKDK